MKRFITLISLFVFLAPSFSQDYFKHKENQNKNHLLIVHPTLSNMERYDFLIENGIIDPQGLEVVGIYFEAEASDYQAAIDSFPEYGFHSISEGLDFNNLFSKNSISEEFYNIFQYSSGIIFNGGPDMPPSTYEEELMNLTVVSDPWRHYYELSFLFHLVGGSQNPKFKPFLEEKPDYLILGICLGLQTMNVAAGGSLIQDIPLEIYGKNTVEEVLDLEKNARHRNYYTGFRIYPEISSYYPHQISINSKSWLSSINTDLPSTPYVLSSHHQCIEKLGAGYKVAAKSIDGKVIESIEHINYSNVIGIQFHPEIANIYKDGDKIKLDPKDESFSLMQRMQELESYDFHLRFWKEVMELL